MSLQEKAQGKEDTCEIIRAKIAECGRVIVLETNKLNNLRRELNRKLETKQKEETICEHVWIYRRSHSQGWRYCQKCRVYEGIEL